MASFCRSAAPPRREWTVEDAARFAALKEFKLLQLLSTDKQALTTARRLGLFLGQTQPQAQTQLPADAADAAAAPASSGAADASSAASSAMPRRARRQSQPLWVNVHTPFTRTALTPPSGRCSHA